MTKTEHYQLNQWDAADPIRREDFNADNTKIDAALHGLEQAKADADTVAALAESLTNTNADLAVLAANVGAVGKNARVAWGTYTGTGTYGSANLTSLSVGFYPVLAVVGSASGTKYGNWPTILIRGCTASQSEVSYLSSLIVTWSDSKIQWYNTEHAQAQDNESGTVYYYCVIGYDKSAE